LSSLYDPEKLLLSIAEDRCHGADDADELRETVKSYARRTAESRPSMATPLKLTSAMGGATPITRVKGI